MYEENTNTMAIPIYIYTAPCDNDQYVSVYSSRKRGNVKIWE